MNAVKNQISQSVCKQARKQGTKLYFTIKESIIKSQKSVKFVAKSNALQIMERPANIKMLKQL